MAAHTQPAADYVGWAVLLAGVAGSHLCLALTGGSNSNCLNSSSGKKHMGQPLPETAAHLGKAMKQIAPALLKAKQAFGQVLKEKTNPAFRRKYADLGACLDAVNEPCLSNGLVLYQETSEDSTGVTVETVFLHESGESLRCGKLHVPANKQDAQGYGSALTYARRYSLLTACGIAPEDDDGNAAVRQPDVANILRSISGSATLDILKSNYESAIQMLEKQHHQAVIKAKDARKAELTQKEPA